MARRVVGQNIITAALRILVAHECDTVRLQNLAGTVNGAAARCGAPTVTAAYNRACESRDTAAKGAQRSDAATQEQ